jgi:hypothetical protein
MDSETVVLNTEQGPRNALILGSGLLAAKLYDQSPAEVTTPVKKNRSNGLTKIKCPSRFFLDEHTSENEQFVFCVRMNKDGSTNVRIVPGRTWNWPSCW